MGWKAVRRAQRGEGMVDCERGRGSNSAPTRPAPRHPSLILPDREDGRVASSPRSEHSSHSFATIAGHSVLTLKGHRLNHRLS